MNTIIYLNKDMEYHRVQLGNYPTSKFFEKCERYGLKICCVVEAGVIKDKCFDFQHYQYTIQSLLAQWSIPVIAF